MKPWRGGKDRQYVRWCVDLVLGVAFPTSFINGPLQFTLLTRAVGLASLVLPLARTSGIRNRSGIVPVCCVAVHLFLYRTWIIAMSRTVPGGRPEDP